MISNTLKTGIFIIAIASISTIGAQEKFKIESKKKELKTDPSERMFKHLDINADNTITLEEFKTKELKDKSKEAQFENQFAEMDTDKNGSLDKTEFKAAFEMRREKRNPNETKLRAKKSNTLEKKG